MLQYDDDLNITHWRANYCTGITLHFLYNFLFFSELIAFKRLLSLLHTSCTFFPMPLVDLSNAYQCPLPNAHKHHVIYQFSPALHLLNPPSFYSKLDLHSLGVIQGLPFTAPLCLISPFFSDPRSSSFIFNPFIWEELILQQLLRKEAQEANFLRPDRSESTFVLPHLNDD